MELRQLKYFIAVADCGSLSRAAKRLFIAQSALSQQMLQLEEMLKVPLFFRSPKGVTLTESGQAFYEHARAIMRQVNDAKAAALQPLADAPAGSVIIGIPPSVSDALALPLYQRARECFPRVEIVFAEELTGNLIEQLRQGRLTLAFLFDDGQLDEFWRKDLVAERLHLISRAQPGQVLEAEIGLREALQAPLILPSQEHGVRQRIERVAQQYEIHSHKEVAEINPLNILRSAVIAGLGSTILPLAPMQAALDAGMLVAQEIREPELLRTITVCASRNLPITRATAAVSRLAVRLVRELCASGQWRAARPIYHSGSLPEHCPRSPSVH